MADSDRGYGIPPAGFRLPAPTRVGRIRLQVADLERSRDWYGRVLGFESSEPAERVTPSGAPGASAAVTAAREAGGEASVGEAVVSDPWGTAQRVRAADTQYHPFP